MLNAFQFSTSRLPGLSRNTYSVEPQNGGGSAGPNTVITFNLPAATLISCREMFLSFSASTAGVDSGGRLPPKIASLIDTVRVSIGGVEVSNIRRYGALQHAKDALMGNRSDSVTGHPDFVRTYAPVSNYLLAGTANEGYGAMSSERPFSMHFLDTIFGTCEPSIIDTAVLNQITIELVFADNSVLSSVAGVGLPGKQSAAGVAAADTFVNNGNSNATYAVSKLQLNVPVISLGNSTLYTEMIQARVSSLGYLELVMKGYHTFETEHNQSTRIDVSSQSIDRVWVCPRLANFQQQGAPMRVMGALNAITEDLTNAQGAVFAVLNNIPQTVGMPRINGGSQQTYRERYTPRAFTYRLDEGAATTRMSLQLNGVRFPQLPFSVPQMYKHSQLACGPYYQVEDRWSLYQYRQNFAVFCWKFCLDSDIRLISGIDGRGSATSVTFQTENVNPQPLIMFVETTQSLRIAPEGRMIEVIS